MGPEDLAQVLRHLPACDDPRVVVGTATCDDAAGYRLPSGEVLLQTLDFITPIVDDPFTYGRIAAANAISDIYAMGGRPLLALNIVCFPSKKLSLEVLGEILRGGADAASEAGIPVVGGHSVDDSEPKYGLVVTGVAREEDVRTNAGARAGDVLVLTKPLGSGILTTAGKKGRCSEAALRAAIDVMSRLNRDAAACWKGLDVSAVTDVTGFGLLGHLLEMAEGAGLTAVLSAQAVPVLPEVVGLAEAKVYPGGAARNRRRCDSQVAWSEGVAEPMRMVLCDPQTSGGLLIAVAEADAGELARRLGEAGTLAKAVVGRFEPRGDVPVRVEP